MAKIKKQITKKKTCDIHQHDIKKQLKRTPNRFQNSTEILLWDTNSDLVEK